MTNIKYYYVYRITDKKRNKYYIGSRTSDVPPEQDLGHVYFSSSGNRKFIAEQKMKPEQFIYEIIKVFPHLEQALEYEKDLIQKHNAMTSNDFYNGRICKKRSDFAPSNSRATKYTLSYLGNLIRIARKERAITQEELAERLGTSRSLVQRIEAGHPKCSIGRVFEACFVLGIPLLGCEQDNVHNLSTMLSYINKILPERAQNTINFNDDF